VKPTSTFSDCSDSAWLKVSPAFTEASMILRRFSTPKPASWNALKTLRPKMSAPCATLFPSVWKRLNRSEISRNVSMMFPLRSRFASALVRPRFLRTWATWEPGLSASLRARVICRSPKPRSLRLTPVTFAAARKADTVSVLIPKRRDVFRISTPALTTGSMSASYTIRTPSTAFRANSRP
jgi:hypothetical protein